MEESLNAVDNNTKWFSTVDLASGFNQVDMDPAGTRPHLSPHLISNGVVLCYAASMRSFDLIEVAWCKIDV